MSSTIAAASRHPDLEFPRFKTGSFHPQDVRPPAGLSSYGRSTPKGTVNWFQGGLPTPPQSRNMTGVSLSNNYGTYPANHTYTHNQQLSQHGSSLQPSRFSAAASSQPSHGHANGSRGTSSVDYGISTEKSMVNVIASHLQIPESINKSKGSITEFAAEVKLNPQQDNWKNY